MILIIIFASAVNFSSSAKALKRRKKIPFKDCPIVNNFESLILKDLNGTWFVLYSSVMNSTTKCTRFVFSVSNSSSTISLFKKSVRFNGVEIKMMGKVVELGPGIFVEEFPAFPSKYFFKGVVGKLSHAKNRFLPF